VPLRAGGDAAKPCRVAQISRIKNTCALPPQSYFAPIDDELKCQRVARTAHHVASSGLELPAHRDPGFDHEALHSRRRRHRRHPVGHERGFGRGAAGETSIRVLPRGSASCVLPAGVDTSRVGPSPVDPSCIFTARTGACRVLSPRVLTRRIFATNVCAQRFRPSCVVAAGVHSRVAQVDRSCFIASCFITSCFITTCARVWHVRASPIAPPCVVTAQTGA
jgi:hypothetical protein